MSGRAGAGKSDKQMDVVRHRSGFQQDAVEIRNDAANVGVEFDVD